MNERLKPGDRVEWNTPQGKAWGRAEKRVTRETRIPVHKVAASPAQPLARSDPSGKRAAHRPEALRRRGDEA